jgi:TonB family protein
MRKTRKFAWRFVLAVLLCTNSWCSEPTVRVVHRKMPTYPALLRALKIGGRVKLRLTVSAGGKVERATIEGGNPMLAELSCVAARKWTYTESSGSSKVAVELEFDPAASQPRVVE